MTVTTTPRTIRFSRCWVLVWDDLHSLQTHFPDKSYVAAAPEDTPAYRATTRLLGYTDPWEMCIGHELMHSFLAEKQDYPYSPTLWRAAHGGTRLMPVNAEEQVVCAVQRRLNGLVVREIDLYPLTRWGWNLDDLLDEARLLLRGEG